jgi:hypothetical protein
LFFSSLHCYLFTVSVSKSCGSVRCVRVYVCIHILNDCQNATVQNVRKPPGDKRASGSTGGVFIFFSQNFISGRKRGAWQHRTTAQRPNHPSDYGHRCGNVGEIISQNEIIFRLLLFRRPRRLVFASKAMIAWPGRWSTFDRPMSLKIFLLFSLRHLSRYPLRYYDIPPHARSITTGAWKSAWCNNRYTQ